MSDRMLTRLFEPIAAAMSEEAARKLLAIKADHKTQARVAKLAKKCNEGELRPAERREYERYIMMGNIVALFRAKALAMLAVKRRAK